jgi:HNH endonuclease
VASVDTASVITLTASDIDRFWSKVKKSAGCWIWEGCCALNGYGQFHAVKNGRLTKCLAHRISWLISNGGKWPKLQVLHRCDNPACVNPEHLWLGTQLDNLRDMSEKGRGSLGERNGWSTHPERMRVRDDHPMAKLTSSDVSKIRARYKFRSKTDSTVAIAKDYGVTQSLISHIIRGKLWKPIPV